MGSCAPLLTSRHELWLTSASRRELWVTSASRHELWVTSTSRHELWLTSPHELLPAAPRVDSGQLRMIRVIKPLRWFKLARIVKLAKVGGVRVEGWGLRVEG